MSDITDTQRMDFLLQKLTPEAWMQALDLSGFDAIFLKFSDAKNDDLRAMIDRAIQETKP